MLASKLKPYPEYRDSDIDWIGKIPKHWQVLRSKYVFSEKDERSISGKEELLGLSKSKGIVRKKEMEQRSSVSNTYVGYKKCIKGDIVMNKLQAWNGVLDVSNHNGIVSPDYTVFEISEEVDKYYGTFLLKSPLFVAQLGRNSKGIGSGFMRLYTDYFGDIEFLIPPTEEQMSISKFIQKIDIIGKSIQQQLEEKLELLEEKRSALITQTVTKGLNPVVSMKDSGIDWIGEIPEHWTIKRIKHIGKLRGGAGFPDQEQGLTDEEIPFHKVNALGSASYQGLIVENTNTISPETASRLGAYVFPKDTIVFAKVGAALLLKRFCLLSEPSCIDNNMMGFIVDESKENVAFIQNSLANISFDKIVNPGAVPSVNGSQIGAIPLAIPPRSEQNKIMEYLLIKTTFFDNVKYMLSRKLDLLKEYKTALISAVVTGKIDVRSL